MTETHPDFLLYSGSTWAFEASLHDAAGDPLDLTGSQVVWRLYNPQGGLKLELGTGTGVTIDDTTNGLCHIELPAAQTAAIAPSTYRDEIVVTASSGFVCTQAVGVINVAKPGSLAPIVAPDASDPCATLGRLQQARLALLTGQNRTRVKIENFEVYYSDVNIDALERAIAHYQTQCLKQCGKGPRRYAIGSGMRRQPWFFRY